MLLMKDRSFLYELRAYLIYVKVGERSFLYELRAYLIYVKVGEKLVTSRHFPHRSVVLLASKAGKFLSDKFVLSLSAIFNTHKSMRQIREDVIMGYSRENQVYSNICKRLTMNSSGPAVCRTSLFI